MLFYITVCLFIFNWTLPQTWKRHWGIDCVGRTRFKCTYEKPQSDKKACKHHFLHFSLNCVQLNSVKERMAGRVRWMKGGSHVNMRTFNMKNYWRVEILSFFRSFPHFTFYFQTLPPPPKKKIMLLISGSNSNSNLVCSTGWWEGNKLNGQKPVVEASAATSTSLWSIFSMTDFLLTDLLCSFLPLGSLCLPSACAVISYTWPINYMINMYDGGGAGLLVQGRLH